MGKRNRRNNNRSSGKKKNPTIKLERCCCEEEANNSFEEGRLLPKFQPHENNPKWIALEGTRPTCKELGKRVNYSHKLLFEIDKEDFNKIKPYLEVKENEDGSFAIPIDKIDEFNEKIINLRSIKLDIKNRRKRRRK